MKAERIPYECARCHYTTFRKDQMRYHLNRTRLCPTKTNDLELTSEIKEIILSQRVYHPIQKALCHDHPHPHPVPLNSITLNNNKHYNYITNIMNSNMTPKQLVDLNTAFHRLTVLPIDEYMDDTFTKSIDDMKKQYSAVELTTGDLLDIIREISSFGDDPNNMSAYYSTLEDNIYILNDAWESHTCYKGLKILIEKIKNFYLDYYECYIINKLETDVFVEREHLIKLLKEYYNFLIAFNIKPFCYDKKDYNIIEEENDEHKDKVSRQYYQFFTECAQNMKNIEKKVIQTDSIDTFKRKSMNLMRLLKSKLSKLYCENLGFQSLLNKEVSSAITT